MTLSPAHPLSLLSPPYATLRPITGGRRQMWTEGRTPGACVVWALGLGNREQDRHLVERRPGGLALILILPPPDRMPLPSELAAIVASCRPTGILPHHETPVAEELAHVLRRPPDDLAAEVTDYLSWRGIPVDRDTRHLLRRTIELSGELRSITGLSRSLYMSRRALGRRFSARGLPVPSHWLQVSRLLRVAIRLQTTEESVLAIAYDLGYPDGFAVSNQMLRLIGHRPIEARRAWGWEWLFEAWLRREAETGGLSAELWYDRAPSRTDLQPRSAHRAGRPVRGTPTPRRAAG